MTPSCINFTYTCAVDIFSLLDKLYVLRHDGILHDIIEGRAS